MGNISNRRTVGTLVFIMIGPILWALQLTAIYGSQSALCALGVGREPGGTNWLATTAVLTASICCMILAAAFITKPAAGYSIMAASPAPEGQWTFFSTVMRGLAALSLLAMAYAGLAALLLPACAQLR